VRFIGNRAVRVAVANTHVQVSEQQIDAPVHNVIMQSGQL
jgi:hypothetical protein